MLLFPDSLLTTVAATCKVLQGEKDAESKKVKEANDELLRMFDANAELREKTQASAGLYTWPCVLTGSPVH